MNEDLYRHVRSGGPATVVLAEQVLWRLSGPDAERYLNGQVTLDLAALPEDEARLAAVCTAKGRMEGAVCVARHGEAFFVDAVPELRDSLGPRLEKYLIADDAVLEALGNAWSLSHVVGVTPPPVPTEGGFVVRHARFGLPGHDVWNSGPGAVIVGQKIEPDLAETLRLEHAIPRWGAELTPQTLPPEAGPVMLAGISYTKGCYVGQETIARLKSVGHVNRTLVLLRAETETFPAPGARLVAGDKEVGFVTSSGFSPRFAAGLALGYVPPALAAEGTRLRADDIGLTVVTPEISA